MTKKLFLLAALALLGTAALAQDNSAAISTLARTIQRDITVHTILPDALVVGQPYSATGVTESNQTLSDGTRIHTQSQYTICRDAEGRERRDSPDKIVISDPVAKVSYVLNPRTHTYTTSAMLAIYTVNTVNGRLISAPNVKTSVTTDGSGGDAVFLTRATEDGGGRGEAGASQVVTANLGTQNIQGVNAVGTRHTTTIPTGAIGNDRPIEVVNERWTSPELQVTVMTRQSDPRSGETVFQLTNLTRSAPDPSLFQIPAGYQPAPAVRRGGGE